MDAANDIDIEGWAEVMRRASAAEDGDAVATAIECCHTPCPIEDRHALLLPVMKSPHNMTAVFNIWRQRRYATAAVLYAGVQLNTRADRLREFLQTIPNHEDIEGPIYMVIHAGGPDMEAKVDALIAAGYDPKERVVPVLSQASGATRTALDHFWQTQTYGPSYAYIWPYSDTLVAKLT